MKILDKLKNALFEEEYVEVEEKPKKKKEKKQKIEKKEIRDTYFNNPEENEKPVAKRIIPQERKNIETLDEEEYIDNSSFRDQSLVDPVPESKITMIDEEDLISDDTPVVHEYETITKRRTEINYEEPKKEEYLEVEKEEPKLYQNSKKENFYDNYVPHAYGNYEKQREKSKEGFKPSPVISPIYGIVEDNSFVEQPRREVRITTPVNRGKMNLDDIRKKAYGSVNINSELEKEEPTVEEEKDNTLVDLSDDSKAPEVSSITMGDAMEYFEDLGLEYNNDYIDKSKMTRIENNNEEQEDLNLENREIKITDNTSLDEDEDETYNVLDDRKFTVNEEIEEHTKDTEDNDIVVTEKKDDEVIDNNDSDNLFDLIDSMYE